MGTTTRTNGTRRGRSQDPATALGAQETVQMVALYARVSTEDQAERDTVQNQLDFLRKYVDLHELTVDGEYVDDGISGGVPLGDRPEGRRLLTDAEAGRFSAVVCYRLTRLGRTLAVIVEAHDALLTHGVTIRSGTESFDTSQPTGMLIFQVLASIAQYDRSMLVETMTLGRNRIAKTGRYVGGPIPLGYDLDDNRMLAPSTRVVPQLGVTEADMVRDIFHRIAAGESTLNAECERLTALGVPKRQRYPTGRIIESQTPWGNSSLSHMLHSRTYMGLGIIESRYGDVERSCVPLVDESTWDAAQTALLRNRKLATKNAKRTYLLRGLVQCDICGKSYVGTTVNGGVRRYRCGSQCSRSALRCEGKALPADWLEDMVWQECRRFILNPGEALDEARRKLRERMTDAAGFEQKRRDLLHTLAEKEAERERVLTLYRRGKISGDEAEKQLDDVAKESAGVREMIESMRSQTALVEAQEAFLTDSTALLARLQADVTEIEATNDLVRKRDVIERYVRQITVESRRVGPRKLEADVRVALRFSAQPSMAVLNRAPESAE